MLDQKAKADGEDWRPYRCRRLPAARLIGADLLAWYNARDPS